MTNSSPFRITRLIFVGLVSAVMGLANGGIPIETTIVAPERSTSLRILPLFPGSSELENGLAFEAMKACGGSFVGNILSAAFTTGRSSETTKG